MRSDEPDEGKPALSTHGGALPDEGRVPIASHGGGNHAVPIGRCTNFRMESPSLRGPIGHARGRAWMRLIGLEVHDEALVVRSAAEHI